MLQRTFTLDPAEISKTITHYTMGFVTVSVKNNVEDAQCAGSGTLITVGSLYGVLTAAHVINALPRAGEVGVVLNVDSPKSSQGK